MKNTILVVLDTVDGSFAPTAAELIAAASAVGAPAVVAPRAAGAAGAADTEYTDALGRLGATRVLVAPEGADTVDAAVAAFEELGPDAVVFAHTVAGRDAAARFAVRAGRALLTDATGIRRDNQGIVTDHSNFGGAYSAVAAATHLAPVITLRVGSVEARAEAAQPEVTELTVAPSGKRAAEVVSVERVERTSSRPDLLTADKVVAGGVSLGSDDMFEELVGGLADALGAAVGATRSAVDEGQVPYEAQIGQTGVVVSPKLYIGVGISGAVQHLVGMQTADTIVAINSDEDAPIFDIADFGIIGDIFDLVPEIIAEVERRKSGEAEQ